MEFVRSEALWGDKGVRYDSSSKLNEAFQETLKLALYAGKGLKVEMTLHIYLLTSYLAQAEALMLKDGGRTAMLEIALNAEKEIESLTTMAAAEQGQADDEARTQPPEERQSVMGMSVSTWKARILRLHLNLRFSTQKSH